MSHTEAAIPQVQSSTPANTPDFTPAWGENAPRGAKVVINRVIKENAQVPLFLGQTMINALRDLGYDDTTSAACEYVDNSLQANAKNIRVYFFERGRKGQKKQIDVVILDDGAGMSPNVLKAACAFGGSMNFDNRKGIGRYGMGMKAAGLSMGPALNIYSWQERGAFYRMVLDTEAIGNDKSNYVMLPEPQLVNQLPGDLVEILTTPMSYPREAQTQELVARELVELVGALGPSGTLIHIPDCDRLTHRKSQTLTQHATNEMARVYRRFLNQGTKIFVNNRPLVPFDPTYSMDGAWHTRVEGLTEKKSRLVQLWSVPVPIEEGHQVVHNMKVKLFLLPIDEWQSLPRKVLSNDLHVFDPQTVSFMRNDREVHGGPMPAIIGKHWTGNVWARFEIEFPAELDEAMGVAVNKQGVRPKAYVIELIRKEVHEEWGRVRARIEQGWAQQAAKAISGVDREAERRANEAEALQGTLLPQPPVTTEEERKALEDQLRAMAVTVKGEHETEEQALERLKKSTYVTLFKHDDDAPFYRTDFQLGRIILTLNTAHPLFEKLYKPLNELSRQARAPRGPDEESDTGAPEPAPAGEALVAFELMLLSLARAQSALLAKDSDGTMKTMLNTLRRQWSLDLATQLATA